MKIALLKGNRFNPWHLQAFKQLRGQPEVVAFRAESEIQGYFNERGSESLQFPLEPIYFDTQVGAPWNRLKNRAFERYAGRRPKVLPFFDRLQGFDLIQSWELFTDWTAQALEARRKWGIPVCVMVWDNIPFNQEHDPARRVLKQQAVVAADRFIVHTERSLRTLRFEGVRDEQIAKIDPGVDVDRFRPGPAQRRTLGLDEDDFVVLFVGWLLPRKGIDFLLLALRDLLRDPRAKGKRVRLLIVGSGPGKDRVEALISRLGLQEHCLFLGSLPYDRMPEIYRASDTYVLPSIATPEWQEQFGMALLEAMASSLPVVSTWSGAIPEIVGDAGTLCQPNDFVALHEALAGLMQSRERRLEHGGRARERVLARFTLGGFAEALSDVYDGVLAKA